jgi:hypothetical protein
MPTTQDQSKDSAADRYTFRDVLLVPEVAKLLRCSEEHVRRLSRRKILRPIAGSRTLRFSGSAVNALLDSGSEQR